MVWYAFPLGEAGLGGADVETAVGLERIGVDDLAPERLGKRQAKRALAGGGGAKDDQEGRALHNHPKGKDLRDSKDLKDCLVCNPMSLQSLRSFGSFFSP